MIKQHNFNFPLNSACSFPSIHLCQANIDFYDLQIFVDLPHISSTKLIFSQALNILYLHSFLMNLAKIPAFRLVLALPRYWRLCSAIRMFVESGCVTALTCLNLHQIFNHMNTVSAFHPAVLWNSNSDLSFCATLPIFFGCEVSRISFKHTFLRRK